jgi:uncharacterized membrane protein YgcG
MSMASMRSDRFGSDSGDKPAGRASRWLLVLAAIALVALLVAWLLGWIRFTTDPRVVEIRQMQAEAEQKFAANGGPQTLEEAKEAVATMSAIREKIETLPVHLRLQAGSAARGFFRTSMQTRINAYFSTPPDKRQAELDRQIKQEELFRQAWEASQPAAAAGQQGGGAAGGQAAGGQGGGTGGGTAQGGGGQGGGGRGGFGPPRGGSEEDRNRWRKNMIDSTTPDQRAKYVEYRRAMDARREQLGMKPAWPR